MDWKVFLPILIQVVKDNLGALAAALLQKLLGGSNHPAVPLMATPSLNFDTSAIDGKAVLKEFLQNLIQTQLDKWTWIPPSLKNVVEQVISQLDGALIDALWTALFQQKLVTAAHPRSVAIATPRPIKVAPEAHGAFFSEFGQTPEQALETA